MNPLPKENRKTLNLKITYRNKTISPKVLSALYPSILLRPDTHLQRAFFVYN